MFLRRFSLAFIIVAIVYTATVQFVFPRYVVDDAYITFRYAENLAVHGELNWNVGEDPVEGYTGAAFPVLLAGFMKMGISPVAASRFVNIVSFWLGFLALYAIARRIALPALGTGGLLVLYATVPILFTHVFSGMETMLFAAFMLSSLYALVARRDALLSFFLLLTSLTRPEGVAFAVAIFVALSYARYREGAPAFKRFLLRAFCIYLLPAALYFFWRFSYYGYLLPNTFYAKLEGGFQSGTLADILRFLRRYFAVPALGLVLLWGVETDELWKRARIWLRDGAAAWYTGAAVFFCLAVTWLLVNAHLIANFSHRFYVPFLPIGFVLIAFGWKLGFSVLEPSKEERPVRYRFVLAIFALLMLYQALFQTVKVRDEIAFARRQLILHEDVHNAVGKELGRILPPTETLIVYVDAGAIPYFSRLRTVDFGNLNDEVLGHRSLSPKERIDYFFSQKAAAVSFSSIEPDTVVYAEEAEAIIADPRFKDYVLYKKYRPRDPSVVYYQMVYLRKDIYKQVTEKGNRT